MAVGKPSHSLTGHHLEVMDMWNKMGFTLLDSEEAHLLPGTEEAIKLLRSRIYILAHDRRPGWKDRESQARVVIAKLTRVIGYLVFTDHSRPAGQACRKRMMSHESV